MTDERYPSIVATVIGPQTGLTLTRVAGENDKSETALGPLPDGFVPSPLKGMSLRPLRRRLGRMSRAEVEDEVDHSWKQDTSRVFYSQGPLRSVGF